MRKIVVAAFVSLDGVMQAPGGPKEDPEGGFRFGGWTVPHFNEEVGAIIGEGFASSFDLLLGRKTYDIFAAHWPRVAADPAGTGVDAGEAAIARAFDAATKYVATHSPESLGWKNSEWLGTDPVARLRDIKSGDGPVLLVQGSSRLIQTLLANDLVDELRLLIYPLTLGRGKRLFGEGSIPAGFRLTSSKTTANGILGLTYERAGGVQVGSFELADKA